MAPRLSDELKTALREKGWSDTELTPFPEGEQQSIAAQVFAIQHRQPAPRIVLRCPLRLFVHRRLPCCPADHHTQRDTQIGFGRDLRPPAASRLQPCSTCAGPHNLNYVVSTRRSRSSRASVVSRPPRVSFVLAYLAVSPVHDPGHNPLPAVIPNEVKQFLAK
jgi:hypothetical protein